MSQHVLRHLQHTTPRRGRGDDTGAPMEGWVVRAIIAIVAVVVAGLVPLDLVRTAA